MIKNGPSSNGRHTERGGEREEDIGPEILEAAFNHAFPGPAPKTNDISERTCGIV